MTGALVAEPPFFGPVEVGFAIERPATLAAAVELSADPGTALVGYASTWIKQLKRREIEPRRIVVLDRIPELQGIAAVAGGVVIGAMTSLADVLRHPLVAERAPLLQAAAATIAGPAIRNWASIGGNVVLRYDLTAPLIALGAEVVSTGPGGERVRSVSDASLDPGFPADGEVVTALRVPDARPAVSGYWRLMPRKGHAFAIVAAAVRVELDGAGTVADARLAVGAKDALRPCELPDARAVLVGRRLDDAAGAAAGQAAAAAVDPVDDGLATPWYRRRMVAVGIARAVARAAHEHEEGSRP